MPRWFTQFGPIIATAALLIFIGGFARLSIATQGVEEFRQRARSAIDALPLAVGPWTATKRPIDARARDLLQPNAESTLLYQNQRTQVNAYYSVVQVKDSRHMTGHAPSNCYRGNGFELEPPQRRTVRVGEFELTSAVYKMRRSLPEGREQRWTVYNFFIFPDGAFGSTLLELDRAAEDYRRLAYGVAQVQVLTFDPRLTDRERDDIFATLVGSKESLEMIRVLRMGIPR